MSTDANAEFECGSTWGEVEGTTGMVSWMWCVQEWAGSFLEQPNVFPKMKGFVAGPRGQREIRCEFAKREIRCEVEKTFLKWRMDLQLGSVGRQHVKLGSTPGGWCKKRTLR